MKKAAAGILSFILVLDLLAFGITPKSSAADTSSGLSSEKSQITSLLEKSIILSINSPCCYVWGKQTFVDKDNMSVMPIIKDGRTLVPIRFVAESLGGTADWDGGTRTATIRTGATTLKIAMDSSTMYVNGKAVALDVPAQNINGRTLIPLRAVSETLNKQVGYYKGFIIVSDSEIILDTTNNDIAQMIEYIRYSMLVYNNQKSSDKISFMNKSVPKSNYFAINSDDIPYTTEPNKLVSANSGMFVENVSCTEKDSGSYNLSMDVYNTMYSYGAIEVYGKDGSWIKTIKIDRFEGSPTSIKDVATGAWNATFGVGWAIGNAIQGDYSDFQYRSAMISACTKVNTDIPKGSFLYISNSITDSQYVLMYDIISTAVDSVSLGSSWFNTFTTSQKKAFLDTAKEKLFDQVSDKLLDSASSNTEFANIVAMNYSLTSFSDYVSSIVQKSLTVLSNLNIDVGRVLQDTAKNVGDVAIGFGESLFKTATAFIGTAMDICFNMSKTTNFCCFISDMRKTMNSDSLLLVAGYGDKAAPVKFSILQSYGGKIITLHDFSGGTALPSAINAYIDSNKYDLVQSQYNLIIRNFAVYNDKIYYLTSEDGTDLLKAAICCCDLDGSNNKMLANDLLSSSNARIDNGKLSYESYNLTWDSTNSYFTDEKSTGVTTIDLSNFSKTNSPGSLKEYFYDGDNDPQAFTKGSKDYYGYQKSVYCRDRDAGKTYVVGTFDLSKVYSITVLDSYDSYVYCQVLTDCVEASQGLYNVRLFRISTTTGKCEYLTSWFRP